MIEFHAVMVDETGCEFGATIVAASRDEAWEKAAEDYPESRCVQLESPADRKAREQELYHSIEREMYGDEDCFDEED